MKEKFRWYAIKLTIIIGLIFILQILIKGFTEVFVLNQNSFIEPWRFLTSIFLHGNTLHLLYNGFALALFGSILERLVGEKKLLIVFFLSGIIANLISINFYNSSLGASGAIFGVIGALIIIRPFMFVWAFGVPLPLFMAGILWVAGDLIGLFIPDNIGNIAHLSGIAVGLLSGIFMKSKLKKTTQTYLTDSEFEVWHNNYMTNRN